MYLLALFALVSPEVWAQSTSSAAQVVTFGVRRMGAEASLASNVPNATSGNPFKITLGYESRFQKLAEISMPSAEKTTPVKNLWTNAGTSNQRRVSLHSVPNSNVSKPVNIKDTPASDFFVTLTE